MATIGQQLLQPESGWKRYDDSNSAIKYDGVWGKLTNTSAFGGSVSEVNIGTAKISFSFKGSKIRFITFGQTNRNSTVNIKIDNTTEVFSQKASSAVWQMLAYEKTGLADSIHSVEIWSDTISSTEVLTIDAIDVDSTGRLLHPHEVLSIDELQVGKRIRCNYKASSGQVGTFSKIGEETYVDGINDFIPPASSATPNGDFYFIMVEDWNGKKRLVADRNIQHSISWDTLNTSGIASGSGLPMPNLSTAPTLANRFKSLSATVRLLTGGVISTDTDNEWNKYIVDSNLNGTISSGDINVWNYNIYSYTSTTSSTASNRALRGYSSNINTHVNLASTTATASTGFRPMLIFEISEPIPLNKTLILHDGKYKKLTPSTPSIIGGLFPSKPLTTNNSDASFIVSASYERSGNEAWKSFDGDAVGNGQSMWYAGTIPTNGSHWIKVKLDTPKIVNGINIIGGGYVVNPYVGALKNWSLYGSNDDISYSLIHTGVKQNTMTFDEFMFENNTPYMYYKLDNLTSHNNDSNSTVGIYEMKLKIKDTEAKYSSWTTVSSTTPTVNQFLEQGIDSLTPLLDRKVMKLEPQTMDSKIGILPQDSTAKVFSKKLDLNKYMDVRKIEVK